MRDMGFEYGTTTGRPRRCGWLDIPLTAFGSELNGYSSINITKLDVLSGLKEVKIGVAYKINGKQMPLGYFPDSLHDLQRAEVVYEALPGWHEDITGCTSWSQLPINAQRYLSHRGLAQSPDFVDWRRPRPRSDVLEPAPRPAAGDGRCACLPGEQAVHAGMVSALRNGRCTVASGMRRCVSADHAVSCC